MYLKPLAVIVPIIFLTLTVNAQSFSWKENFGTDETCGILPADGFTTPNGEWTVEMSGPNGTEAHEWYVGAREAGRDDGDCNDGCISNENLDQRTLYISGSSYSDTMGAVFSHSLNSVTDLRVVSPVIDMTNVDYEMALKFSYILGDHPSASCTVQYFDGSAWSDLVEIEPSSDDCDSGVEWMTSAFTFPPSAQNNPNVRIGFRWVNTGPDEMNAPELSFAVSEIECICSVLGDVDDVQDLFLYPIPYVIGESASPVSCSFCIVEPWETIDGVQLLDADGNSIDNIELMGCSYDGIPGWCSIDDSEDIYYSVSGCGSEVFEGLLESNSTYQYDPGGYYNGGFELEEDTLCGPGCIGFTFENGILAFSQQSESALIEEIEVEGGTIEILNEQPWGDTSGEICLVEPGTYTVTAFSYICGYSSNYEADIVVVEPESVPVISASATSLCAGECVDFTLDSAYAEEGMIWVFEGADTDTLMDVVNPTNICYAETGSYPVTLLLPPGSENCSLGVLEGGMTVLECNDPPIAAFSISDTLICEGECIDFADQSTGTDINSWLWMFEGADTLTSSDQNPTNVCFDSSGAYTVSLEVGNLAGTSDTILVDFITVEACAEPVSDLVISNAKYGSYDPAVDSTWKDLEYTEYHTCQVRPLDLSATARNLGDVSHTNAYLEVNISDGDGFSETLSSDPADIAAGDSVQFAIDDYLPPNDPGEYELSYTIYSDQPDSIPENNSTNRNFRVQSSSFFVYTGNSTGFSGYMMARDSGVPIASSQNGTGNQFMAGIGFNFTESAEVCCIGAAIVDSSSIGGSFRFRINNRTSFEPLFETNVGIVEPSMLYDSSEFIWLSSAGNGIFLVDPNSDLIAVFVEVFNQDTTQSVHVGISDHDAPANSSFVFGEFDGEDCTEWCESDATYMIRLGLSNSFCNTAVAEIAEHVTELKCVPNPSAGDVSVQFNLIKQSEIQLFLFDNMGRVMHKQDFGLQSTGSYNYDYNWSDLSSGVYTLSIVSENKAMTQKLVIE